MKVVLKNIFLLKKDILNEAKKCSTGKNTWVKIYVNFNMEIIKIENISHLEKNIAWMLNKKPYTERIFSPLKVVWYSKKSSFKMSSIFKTTNNKIKLLKYLYNLEK